MEAKVGMLISRLLVQVFQPGEPAVMRLRLRLCAFVDAACMRFCYGGGASLQH